MLSAEPEGGKGHGALGSGSGVPVSSSVAGAGTISGRIRSVDGVVTLSLTGEFDLASQDVFRGMLASIEATAPRGIEVDVRKLEFMDLTGVRALVAAQRRALGAHSFAVLNGSGPAHRMLELAKVEGELVMVNRGAEHTESPPECGMAA